MKRFYLVMTTAVIALSVSVSVKPQDRVPPIDIMQDTWVACDGLGRHMPTSKEAGLPKTGHERVVGMFYVTWHTPDLFNMTKDHKDVTQILHSDPEARIDGNRPSWPKGVGMWHWGEPEYGYFLSQDRYVIRHDMSMFADAGIDVIIFDATNAVCYWDEWNIVMTTLEQMKHEGNKVPKICFWTFNGPSIAVTMNIYDRYYRKGLFKDLWFYWKGRPLMLCNGEPGFDATPHAPSNPNPFYDADAVTNKRNPHYGNDFYTQEFMTDYPEEVKRFFCMRSMWWGYNKWNGHRYVGTEDNWSFGFELSDSNVAMMTPEELVSKHKGVFEEMPVTPAQHPMSGVGKCWTKGMGEPPLNRYDEPDSAYVPWLDRTVKHPTDYGIYFQDRWEDALKVDPEFIYLNDWNEWTAGKYTINFAPGDLSTPGPSEFLHRKQNTFYFVDQYNAEFNRTIAPMKGGYTDNYYMQMAENIRRYKGVRPIPINHGLKEMPVAKGMEAWKSLQSYYLDTRGDTVHRNHKGYAGRIYVNNTGRNDIVKAKVAVGKKQIYFYVETANRLSDSFEPHWMWLLVDVDNDSKTGWYGYDYLINYKVKDRQKTTVVRYDADSRRWIQVAEVPYARGERQLEVVVPRKLLGLKGDKITFDFKWTDNVQSLTDPISLCTDGDTAPNRRFNYRFIWER